MRPGNSSKERQTSRESSKRGQLEGRVKHEDKRPLKERQEAIKKKKIKKNVPPNSFKRATGSTTTGGESRVDEKLRHALSRGKRQEFCCPAAVNCEWPSRTKSAYHREARESRGMHDARPCPSFTGLVFCRVVLCRAGDFCSVHVVCSFFEIADSSISSWRAVPE